MIGQYPGTLSISAASVDAPTVFFGNTAEQGGAIWMTSAVCDGCGETTMKIFGSSFAFNRAQQGAAIYVTSDKPLTSACILGPGEECDDLGTSLIECNAATCGTFATNEATDPNGAIIFNRQQRFQNLQTGLLRQYGGPFDFHRIGIDVAHPDIGELADRRESHRAVGHHAGRRWFDPAWVPEHHRRQSRRRGCRHFSRPGLHVRSGQFPDRSAWLPFRLPSIHDRDLQFQPGVAGWRELPCNGHRACTAALHQAGRLSTPGGLASRGLRGVRSRRIDGSIGNEPRHRHDQTQPQRAARSGSVRAD